MIAGLVVLLVILCMFLQTVTSQPRSDAEWQNDTEQEPETTPAHTEETHAVTA